MQHIYTTSKTPEKSTRDNITIAIFPPLDKPPFSQNRGHDGKEGAPHKPLLPERLRRDIV